MEDLRSEIGTWKFELRLRWLIGDLYPNRNGFSFSFLFFFLCGTEMKERERFFFIFLFVFFFFFSSLVMAFGLASVSYRLVSCVNLFISRIFCEISRVIESHDRMGSFAGLAWPARDFVGPEKG